jgi:hypothetical protein
MDDGGPLETLGRTRKKFWEVRLLRSDLIIKSMGVVWGLCWEHHILNFEDARKWWGWGTEAAVGNEGNK